MALPTRGIPWPPPGVGREIARVAELAAWYAGDLDVIGPAAGAPASKPPAQPGWRDRLKSAYTAAAGNVRPGWTETNPIVVPVAADIARTSADLLFGECPDFTVGEESAPNPQAQSWLEGMVDDLGMESALLEAGEFCAALSGMYWRVTWDPDYSPDRPIVSWIQPDNAWPEWSWGSLRAVTFWRVLPAPSGRRDGNSEDVWRHLERHSMVGGAALVEHGLYVGKRDQLGRRLPLTDHPETERLAASLTGPDGDQIVMPSVSMTAGYVPNMRPNRIDRGSPLGRPDIEQLGGLLRAVNDAWTSWLRDLRLGKGRIIVPDEYLRVGDPGQGAYFDVDREAYSALRVPPGEGVGLTVLQFAIRHAEHAATIRALLQQIVTSAGYDLRAFGMGQTDMSPTITATQVRSEDELTSQTREKKTRYWEPELRKMAQAMLSLAAAMKMRGAVPFDPSTVDVEFAEEAKVDPATTAQTVNLWAQAQAASTMTMVREIHPDWSEDDVIAEVARIQGERGQPAPDPTMIGALNNGEIPAVPQQNGQASMPTGTVADMLALMNGGSGGD